MLPDATTELSIWINVRSKIYHHPARHGTGSNRLSLFLDAVQGGSGGEFRAASLVSLTSNSGGP